MFVLLFLILSYFIRQFTLHDEEDVDCNTAKSRCQILQQKQRVAVLGTEEKLTGLRQEVQDLICPKNKEYLFKIKSIVKSPGRCTRFPIRFSSLRIPPNHITPFLWL